VALDFPASPAEGAIYAPGNNAFQQVGGKWRQERGWAHLDRDRNGVDFPYNRVLPAGFTAFKILFRNHEPYAVKSTFYMRVSVDGGSLYYANVGAYAWGGSYATTTSQGSWNPPGWVNGTTYIPLSAGLARFNGGGPSILELDIDPGDAHTFGSVNWRGMYWEGSTLVQHWGHGYLGAGPRWTNLQFFYSSDNGVSKNTMVAGSYDLFGAP